MIKHAISRKNVYCGYCHISILSFLGVSSELGKIPRMYKHSEFAFHQFECFSICQTALNIFSVVHCRLYKKVVQCGRLCIKVRGCLSLSIGPENLPDAARVLVKR